MWQIQGHVLTKTSDNGFSYKVSFWQYLIKHHPVNYWNMRNRPVTDHWASTNSLNYCIDRVIHLSLLTTAHKSLHVFGRITAKRRKNFHFRISYHNKNNNFWKKKADNPRFRCPINKLIFPLSFSCDNIYMITTNDTKSLNLKEQFLH